MIARWLYGGPTVTPMQLVRRLRRVERWEVRT